ncbi:hypothetical protein RJ641_017635 [Dillenia turbinata]|uniref:Uncharacterized protein n=1 Tax=Dillenia turbinata TaxID=194707 RepID=A0AAN8UMK0_9MAGN
MKKKEEERKEAKTEEKSDKPIENELKKQRKPKRKSGHQDEFGVEFQSVRYLNGLDHEGYPVCYNIFGVFDNEEIFQKTFGTKEKNTLKIEDSVMEKGIKTKLQA